MLWVMPDGHVDYMYSICRLHVDSCLYDIYLSDGHVFWTLPSDTSSRWLVFADVVRGY